MAAYFIHQNISDQQKFKQKEQPKQLYNSNHYVLFPKTK